MSGMFGVEWSIILQYSQHRSMRLHFISYKAVHLAVLSTFLVCLVCTIHNPCDPFSFFLCHCSSYRKSIHFHCSAMDKPQPMYQRGASLLPQMLSLAIIMLATQYCIQRFQTYLFDCCPTLPRAARGTDISQWALAYSASLPAWNNRLKKPVAY